jgi:hypothetical protein
MRLGLPFSTLSLAALCAGCGLDPVTSVAASVASNAGMNLLFGESKQTRDSKAAYERAPPCAAMRGGLQNGRIVTMVRGIAWFDSYQFPDGRELTPARGKSLVLVDYEIVNRSDDDVIVSPRRLTVTDARGRLTHGRAGVGGLQTDAATPDEGAILPIDRSWPMVSVFEVTPGDYALMVPNGRLPEDPEPTWVDACRFPGPAGERTSR